MAAANWVCLALLISLCLGMCSGKRLGLSAMDKDARELVSLNQVNNISHSTHEVGAPSSSVGNGAVIHEEYCVDDECIEIDDSSSVDIVGGCDLMCSCMGRGFGVARIAELAQSVKELTRKLDGQGSGQNINGIDMNAGAAAAAPESG
ncbi:hypothetical protein DITRI_Ditri19aG0035700 [Diplodiscus trichospermus]